MAAPPAAPGAGPGTPGRAAGDAPRHPGAPPRRPAPAAPGGLRHHARSRRKRPGHDNARRHLVRQPAGRGLRRGRHPAAPAGRRRLPAAGPLPRLAAAIAGRTRPLVDRVERHLRATAPRRRAVRHRWSPARIRTGAGRPDRAGRGQLQRAGGRSARPQPAPRARRRLNRRAPSRPRPARAPPQALGSRPPSARKNDVA